MERCWEEHPHSNNEDGVKIGPGSVVLKPLPKGVTAFGVPAKIVGDDQYFGPKLWLLLIEDNFELQ